MADFCTIWLHYQKDSYRLQKFINKRKYWSLKYFLVDFQNPFIYILAAALEQQKCLKQLTWVETVSCKVLENAEVGCYYFFTEILQLKILDLPLESSFWTSKFKINCRTVSERLNFKLVQSFMTFNKYYRGSYCRYVFPHT